MSVAGQLEVLAVAPDRRALRHPEVRVRAVREQRLHEVEAAPQHGRVERRVADAAGVGIRAFRRAAASPPPAGRCARLRRARSCRPAARRSRPRPLRCSSPADSASPDARGEQQRRAAAARHGVVQRFAAGTLRHLARHGLRVGAGARAHVGAGLRAARRRRRDASARRPTSAPSGRGVVPCALTLAPRASSALHRFHVAGARARHERRLAVQQRRVGIGAGGQQRLHHRRAAVDAREVERRRAGIVGRRPAARRRGAAVARCADRRGARPSEAPSRRRPARR